VKAAPSNGFELCFMSVQTMRPGQVISLKTLGEIMRFSSAGSQVDFGIVITPPTNAFGWVVSWILEFVSSRFDNKAGTFGTHRILRLPCLSA